MTKLLFSVCRSVEQSVATKQSPQKCQTQKLKTKLGTFSVHNVLSVRRWQSLITMAKLTNTQRAILILLTDQKSIENVDFLRQARSQIDDDLRAIERSLQRLFPNTSPSGRLAIEAATTKDEDELPIPQHGESHRGRAATLSLRTVPSQTPGGIFPNDKGAD